MTYRPNPKDFKLQGNPIMQAAGVIQGDRWRIGLITDSLVRLEWSDDGVFEDRQTQVVINRDFGAAPAYRTWERDGLLVIDTDAITLTYDRRPFSKEGLSIIVKGVRDSQHNTWHYGDNPAGNLKGTARTLDEADGRIPLDDGVISRDGWAVLDDSTSNLIVQTDEANGKPNPFGTWVTPRNTSNGATIDLYFFGYGRRYTDAVRDFYRLTGPQPLLPRFALGNWWSRYYPYTQDEYLKLMDRFKAEGIPFTTSVIDMDWHLVDDVDPKYGSGWTGYTWNGKLFPDHVQFLGDLHERGLKATLNVHPRDGIRAFEERYPQVAEAVGVDPSTGENIEFDPSDPRFMAAYLDMHHGLESEGVDFWWLDWQQGGVTRQPGLDPLWGLNHMHYLDSGRDGRWPMTFSRYAGPGSHRYPVGFSGDTIVTWESLAFQPEFTATASNIGYGWWSHDIGGHMFGYRDDELEARWYQLGVFSPINRLHSSNSPFAGKEPWNFPPDVRRSMTASLRLRHALIPYLHSMNYRAHEQGRPIVEPMYWLAPDNPAAYAYPDTYWFGSELVAAPIVRPMDRAAQRGSADLWLPQGEWFDLFDGRRYTVAHDDGRRFSVWRALDRIPVFAKAGAIVPLQQIESGTGVNAIGNPETLELLVFPGADGAFTIREDNGTFGSASADTRVSFEWNGERADGEDASALTIHAVEGDAAAVPARRDWRVTFRGVASLDAGSVNVLAGGAGDGKAATAVPCTLEYDEDTLSLTVAVSGIPTDADLRIEAAGLAVADDPAVRDAYDLILHAQMRYWTKDVAYREIRRDGVRALAGLRALDRKAENPHDYWVSEMPEGVIGALEEILTR